jgi:hypothetical protein
MHSTPTTAARQQPASPAAAAPQPAAPARAPRAGARPSASPLNRGPAADPNLAAAKPGAALAQVHEALRAPGRPLDDGTRGAMESRLGADLGDVRVHTDERAAASARAVDAIAYTVGTSIVFDRGRYAPHEPGGRDLLVHELVHAIQQRHAPHDGPLRLGPLDSPHEREARSVAATSSRGARAGRGAPAVTAAGARVVARQPRNYRDEPIGSPDYSTPESDVDDAITRLHRKRTDVLGTITGLDAVTDADERRRVKYLIQTYFETGGARHEEIDAVVTIRGKIAADTTIGAKPARDRTVLFTLRFTRRKTGGPSDVEVVRIGELDLTRLDISHVAGFPGPKATTAQLASWAGKRFPSLAGTTPKPKESSAAYLTRLDAERTKGSSTPAWFKANYGIEILAAATADTRIAAMPGFADRARRAGLKDWEPERLPLVELALEPVGDVFRGRLRDVGLARQDVKLNLVGRRVVTDSHAVGLTLGAMGKGRVVIFYDSLVAIDGVQFVGGTQGARSASAMKILHEFGHAEGAGDSTDPVKRFNELFVAPPRSSSRKPTTAPTAYGRSDPGAEFFAEAFALFHGDPEYLQAELPEVFKFFEDEIKPAP